MDIEIADQSTFQLAQSLDSGQSLHLNSKIEDGNIDEGDEDAKSDLENNKLNTNKAINEGTNLRD